MFKILQEGKTSWLYADETSEGVMKNIKKLYRIHSLDIEDVLSDVHDPKLDVYSKYFFAIFNLPHYNARTKNIVIAKLNIFIGSNFLITIHENGLNSFEDFFKKIKGNAKIRREWMSKGADFMLFKILQHLFKSEMRPMVDIISKKLVEMEKNVYEIDQGDIAELAALRRNILSMRRLVDPQRFIISSLGTNKVGLIREEYNPYFDDIRDYLDKVWARLDNYKDTIDGLYETNESLMAYKTNEVIKILTIISVSLMPLTLLASIYGMNIDLPFVGKQHLIWGMFGCIAVFMLMVFYMLKKKKWF